MPPWRLFTYTVFLCGVWIGLKIWIGCLNLELCQCFVEDFFFLFGCTLHVLALSMLFHVPLLLLLLLLLLLMQPQPLTIVRAFLMAQICFQVKTNLKGDLLCRCIGIVLLPLSITCLLWSFFLFFFNQLHDQFHGFLYCIFTQPASNLFLRISHKLKPLRVN